MNETKEHGATYRIRSAERQDLPFLREMLYESMYVVEGEVPFGREILDDPAIRKYVDGWGRTGDFGVIAEQEDGTPLGSATARYFTSENRGYGFVAEDIPELGMALLPESRGRGIGRVLLAALLEGLRDRGTERVSLSVDPRNEPAMKLYRRFGFEEVGREGTSITMVVSLQNPTETDA